MWPFTKPKPDETLLNRVQALESRLDAMDRERKSLKLEWDDIFEKFSRLYARLVKRSKAELEAPEMPSERKTGAGEEGDVNPAALALLNGNRSIRELLSR